VIAPPAFLFDDLSLDELRARRSIKWTHYPPDVLPAWVAEMDFALAPPVHAVLASAVERNDMGYANTSGLPAAFAAFAAERFRWAVDPERVLPTADILSGIGNTLDVLTEPGDRVNPPRSSRSFATAAAVFRSTARIRLASRC
jgi:cystathionine beta-lyase